MDQGENGTIHIAVVTGATGYMASELCKQLLERGWTVHATVRGKTESPRTEHLRRLGEGLPGSLKLFHADLLSPGSFLAAVRGSHVVFHTASPFQIKVNNQQKELVDPAVIGTRNVLSAVVKSQGSVRRVVLTSSVAAVHGGASKAPPKDGLLYSEEDWNETSTLDNDEGYWVSKTRAERAAWEYCRERSIDLVTILPEFNLGPALSSRADAGLSVQFMQGWLEGTASTGASVICDVRDVARAHILAAERPAASGRYMVSLECPISPHFVSDTLRAAFPQWDIPDGEEVECKPVNNSNKSLLDLGLHLTSPKDTLVDMARTCVRLGLARARLKQHVDEEQAAKKQKT